LTSALEGGEGSASRRGRTLPPGKTRYPLYRRLGGPQDRSGQVQKISTLGQVLKLNMWLSQDSQFLSSTSFFLLDVYLRVYSGVNFYTEWATKN